MVSIDACLRFEDFGDWDAEESSEGLDAGIVTGGRSRLYCDAEEIRDAMLSPTESSRGR